MLVLIFCHITFDLSLSFENDHNQYLQTEKKLKSEAVSAKCQTQTKG